MATTHHKSFATVEDQISILKNEKGIVISDEDRAKEILRRVGYFPLISGYKHPFRIPLTKTYKNGVTFDEIVGLYRFDVDMRELVFRYLLQVERHMRNLISYYFSEVHGEQQMEYLDINNYNSSSRNRRDISRLVSTLSYACNSSYDCIEYYRTTYGNIPLWVLVNVLTFGNISKMFKVSEQGIQSKVCQNFGTINPHQMECILSVLTKFRNVCAHGERLFSYRTVDTLTNLPLHRKLNIPMNGSQYACGKNDLFAVVISLRYLLPPKDFRTFKKKLLKLIENANKEINHISKQDLLKYMGFPNNWKDVTRYKI